MPPGSASRLVDVLDPSEMAREHVVERERGELVHEVRPFGLDEPPPPSHDGERLHVAGLERIVGDAVLPAAVQVLAPAALERGQVRVPVAMEQRAAEARQGGEDRAAPFSIVEYPISPE